MTRLHLRRLVWTMCLGLATFSLSSCSRRAPGPDECVYFAEMTFGHKLEVIVQDSRAKGVFDRLVTTCLTAPFDRRVFVCSRDTHAPMDCLRRFQPDLFSDQGIDFALERDF